MIGGGSYCFRSFRKATFSCGPMMRLARCFSRSRSASRARSICFRDALSSGKSGKLVSAGVIVAETYYHRIIYLVNDVILRRLFPASFSFCPWRRALIARHALELRYIDSIQNHGQLASPQLHRACSLFRPRQFEYPGLEALVP